MEKELEQFNRLKSEISQKMNEKFAMSSLDITQWKGQDIVFFQEELELTVKGRISSKWFYTHIKSSGDSLPRIDVLNMLCAYVGYQNWSDFAGQEEPLVPLTKQKYFWLKLIVLAIPFFIIMSVMVFGDRNPAKYTITVIDFDTNKPPVDPIQIHWIQEGESAKVLTSDSAGNIQVLVNNNTNQFILKSAYYKPDTLTRWIKQEGGEIFKIKTDDYALMVDYFSNSKVEDWKRRRQILNDIFDDGARIVEVIGDNIGIEYYSKEEFVNKLTLPLSSLKSLQVLSTERKNGKIIKMRVKQKI